MKCLHTLLALLPAPLALLCAAAERGPSTNTDWFCKAGYVFFTMH